MGRKKYTEIFKLRKKLNDIDLEHTFVDRSDERSESYQIVILDDDGNKIISVIQNEWSYGNREDLLEIMGLLTPEEEKHDEVIGWLTSDNVYERIMKYYGSREKF